LRDLEIKVSEQTLQLKSGDFLFTSSVSVWKLAHTDVRHEKCSEIKSPAFHPRLQRDKCCKAYSEV
jgi:hypothetical protein